MENKLEKVLARYPEQINAYCSALIEKFPALAPLYKADERELDSCGLETDGLGEKKLSPFPHLIRTYQNRALLLTTGSCFSRCRFCFRKRTWRTDDAQLQPPCDGEIEQICAWLREHTEIDDVLLSGGDVMTLPDEKIRFLVNKIKAVPNICTIRVCSRAPAAAPSRITDGIADFFASVDGLWFVTHFNHPDELTDEAKAACRRLVSRGVPMLNQSVLLKGVNDNSETLMRLFRELAALRVKPHYLFHVDPVEGVAHFATGLETGLKIMDDFRLKLSSIARPDFAIDLPDCGGKVILTPDYSDGNGKFWSGVKQRYMVHPLAGGQKFENHE